MTFMMDIISGDGLITGEVLGHGFCIHGVRSSNRIKRMLNSASAPEQTLSQQA